MSELLERRYTRLLRCYPAADRARFGDDLIATLLDSARPGQRWPDRRQSAALVLAGLRARAGSGQWTGRQVRAHGLQIATVGLLIHLLVTDMHMVIVQFTNGMPLSRTYAVSAGLSLTAAFLAMRGRFLTAAGLAFMATVGNIMFGAARAIDLGWSAVDGSWLRYLLAALALAALATVLPPGRSRRSAWWLIPLGTVAGLYYLAYTNVSVLPSPQPIRAVIMIGLPLACAGWAFIDPRGATAAAWWALATLTLELISLPNWSPDYPSPWYHLGGAPNGFLGNLETPAVFTVVLLLVTVTARKAARHLAHQ